MTPLEFIARWEDSAAAELANSQSFLNELCTLLNVPHPDPTQQDDSLNVYVFEKGVAFNNGDGTTSPGRIDLYKRDCFVLESKQGSERKAAEVEQALAIVTRKRKLKTGTAPRGTTAWDQAMVKARQQAKRYAEALPGEWPPFLIVVDIGYCFDLYADFSQSGKNYTPFPDPVSYRIPLADLANDSKSALLRTIWSEPHSLDPSRRSAKVTRELASRLARLAKSLESQKDVAGQPVNTAERVAQFLMRCLFTMFAEDVELIEKASFTDLLKSLRGDIGNFCPVIEDLWQKMNTGGFSPVLRQHLRQFNGGLFAHSEALPLNEDQLELLIEASEAQWSEVEPAIFGTLLERALDPVERHKLGAHYTPRAYVERLVMPTVIEPLRAEWDSVYATAARLNAVEKTADAIKAVWEFHEHLCETRVLDPACGSGNFLYVSLELMKRLEGEVVNSLREFGARQMPLLTVDPHQFLGIEVNPRAAAIADLVLWIGYLQWHFRTRGQVTPPEPIIRNFRNIECRDAVLAWDAVDLVFDDAGKPVTRWDGRSTKPHPVTGEEVPDETARIQELRYINPRKAKWHRADYVVGNPPFVGSKQMRESLGDGYVSALRDVYAEIPKSADYVMYWWSAGANAVIASQTRRSGLISTNGITAVFNKRVVTGVISQSDRCHIAFAIPDHPWIDSIDAASVRIAMTVVASGPGIGRIDVPVDDGIDTRRTAARKQKRSAVPAIGWINDELRISVSTSSTTGLLANGGLTSMGVQLYGDGFILECEEAERLQGTTNPGSGFDVIRPFKNGRDVMATNRNVYVIDFFGQSETESRALHPAAFQIVHDRVLPVRRVNRRKPIRDTWWRFGWERPVWRGAVQSLDRFIVTCRTAKHRVFAFLDIIVLPESKLVAIAASDAFVLGIFVVACSL
jgi:hypothetical protein